MNKIIEYTEKDVRRFWQKVAKRGPDDCWLWQAGTDKDGYGKFWVNGETIRANRFSYLLNHGAQPAGLLVCHSCDHPPCVNGVHLFLGTCAQNTQDSALKERHSSNHQPIGEGNYAHKLTETQIQEIKTKRLFGFKERTLANDYGVCQSVIHRILTNQTWKHLS